MHATWNLESSLSDKSYGDDACDFRFGQLNAGNTLGGLRGMVLAICNLGSATTEKNRGAALVN